MNAIDYIFKRRSIRKFQDEPVKDSDIQLILEAAMSAPSACNHQPWEFVVVTNPDILLELRQNLFFGKYKAPLAIVVCANMNYIKGGAARYWEQDCSAAMENILLSSTMLELGSVWIGIHPLPSVIQPVKKILNIPKHVEPLGLAYIGYSAEEKASRTQFDSKRVFYDVYETRKIRAREKNLKYKA